MDEDTVILTPEEKEQVLKEVPEDEKEDKKDEEE
jgi:hypothetical protein